MKYQLTSVIAGVAALAALSTLAPRAQAATDTLPVQYPFAVKLGAAFPTDSGYSSTTFDAGVSYDFSKTTADKPVIYQGYVDYYGKNSASLTGIGVAAQFLLGNATSATRPYVGVGIGYYIAHTSGSSTESNVGGKVFAGYNFTQNVFGEVDYSITDKVDGKRPDAVGVRVGYRF